MKYFFYKTSIILFFILPVVSNGQTIDKMISVGGYQLHFNIWEGNNTTILFENGAGDDATIWKGIVEKVHRLTGATIVTYDRAGFGKSGLPPKNLNLIGEIKSLEFALKKLGLNQDLILVGHSYGGFCSTLLAARNPNKILAYLAIDANLQAFFTEERVQEIKQWYVPKMEEFKANNKGMYNLYRSMDEDLAIMKNNKFPLNIPVVDIVAERQVSDSLMVMKYHSKFVLESKFRELKIAKSSGHYIFKDQPDLTIQEIVSMYNKYKK